MNSKQVVQYAFAWRRLVFYSLKGLKVAIDTIFLYPPNQNIQGLIPVSLRHRTECTTLICSKSIALGRSRFLVPLLCDSVNNLQFYSQQIRYLPFWYLHHSESGYYSVGLEILARFRFERTLTAKIISLFWY